MMLTEEQVCQKIAQALFETIKNDLRQPDQQFFRSFELLFPGHRIFVILTTDGELVHGISEAIDAVAFPSTPPGKPN